MHSKLAEIISKTREDLLRRKKQRPFNVILNEVKDIKIKSGDSSLVTRNDNLFNKAIISPKHGSIAIIAEVKFASPTEDSLGSSSQLLERVKQYEKAGADVISIVTEKHFFRGDPKFVGQIKKATSLPVLQKDFILDEYQVCEVAKVGADAILLIAKLLSKEQLVRFIEVARGLGLEPVVEISDEIELEKAVATNARIVAVNARDLDTFIIDVDKACKLLQKIPDNFIKLGFSGIRNRVEVEKYQKAGAKGILIGTSLMKTRNIVDYISSLV